MTEANVQVSEFTYTARAGSRVVEVTARYMGSSDDDYPSWRVSATIDGPERLRRAGDCMSSRRILVDDKGTLTFYCYDDVPHDYAKRVLEALVAFTTAEAAALRALAEVVLAEQGEHDRRAEARLAKARQESGL